MSSRAVLGRLLPYFRPYRTRLLFALTAMAGVAGLTAGVMGLLKKVVDQALIGGDRGLLRDVVLLVPLIYLVKAALSYAHDYVTSFVGQDIVRRLRDQAYAHIHTLSLDYHAHTDSARVVARLTSDAQLLQAALAKIPVVLVRDGLTVSALTGFLIYLNWKFSLMAVVLLVVSGHFLARFARSLRKYSRQGQDKMADLYTLIQETISGAPVVKAYRREAYEKERFERENKSYFAITMKNARVESLSSPVTEFIGAAGLAVILWLGGRDVLNHVWTTGAFFAFIGGAMSLLQPVKNFSRSNNTIQQALVGAEKLFQLMDQRPTVAERPGAVDPGGFAREIVLHDLTFAYRPGTPVLSNVNLRIERGRAVALVGPSGSGKSTLASLLLRFYDPTEGAVLLDGRDLRDVTLGGLRGLMGLVTQESLLFNVSVRDNIGYGRPGASEEEILAAARAANAWEFIERLPRGLDTLIGERGILLSGGQKQRLALARAILKNPPILILDEATSALDAQSEKLVQEAVERLMKDRTVVMIAHRLATVKNADVICVLEHGKIVEQGSHRELLGRGGLYQKLYELQLLEG
jgi:subfamily B ATP-binding cassette protein MsbA